MSQRTAAHRALGGFWWVAAAIACWSGPASADVMVLPFEHYVAHVGDPKANFFNGKLLTAEDLDQEQSYGRSTRRYLGDTDLPLAVLFLPDGFANIVLMLDGGAVSTENRSDAEDPESPHASDFIVLDLEIGTWRGRLFLDAFGDTDSGVYDDLSGTFTGLVQTPAPAVLVPFVLALLASRRLRSLHQGLA